MANASEVSADRPELEQLLKDIIRMFMSGHLQFRPRVSQIPSELERSVSRLRQARGPTYACKGPRPSRPRCSRAREFAPALLVGDAR